jgi:hypothetical protein
MTSFRCRAGLRDYAAHRQDGFDRYPETIEAVLD